MMRFVIILNLILFHLVCYSQSNELTVHIKDISEINGTVKIAAFSNKDDFKHKINPIDSTIQVITTDQAIFTFKKLEPGIYAIAVFHDANNDGILNKRQFGIPVEGVGFSNFNTKRRRPPTFEESSFQLQSDTALQIRLFYDDNK